jgi:hypothetical protein
MGLTRTQVREALQLLAAEHPAAHPYTLTLLLEARTGTRISGALARELLDVPARSKG